MRYLLLTFCMLWCIVGKAQESYQDTLLLNGPNLEDISAYASYWIDNFGGGGLEDVQLALKQGNFRRWKRYSNLNLGFNPHPLWIRLTVKNIHADALTYWVSLYSHADTVIYYHKMGHSWVPMDTAYFREPYGVRDVNVRFLASPIHLQSGESLDLLVKVRNLRKSQNAFMDITTPDHNLQWEKKFFWSIGFISGCLMLAAGLSVVLGFVTRERSYFYLFVYLVLVNLVILQEELLIVLYPLRSALPIFMRLPTIGLIVIGCSLHYFIIQYITGKMTDAVAKWLNRINMLGLYYGLTVTAVYFLLYEHIHSGLVAFKVTWYLSVGIIFLILLIQAIVIIRQAKTGWHYVPLIGITILMFYFSPAGYFLNYEGVVAYYTITYPNYFFWGLALEMLAFGLVIGWRYRRTLHKNTRLLQEQSLHQSELFLTEIQTQERERMQIARDLHDDLGATISAINLVVTNSYKDDQHLLKMVSKANKDLRFFLSNFSGADIRYQGLFGAVAQKVAELNALNKTKLTFSHSGDESRLPQDMALAIYRMCSELLANVLKHAAASKADVQIVIEESQALMIVEDDGKGFDTSRRYVGMGMKNVENRAEAFHGNVHVTSNQRSGTTIIVTLPLKE